jgi:hypothetical protein
MEDMSPMYGMTKSRPNRALSVVLFVFCYLVWLGIFLVLAAEFLLDSPFWVLACAVFVFVCSPLIFGVRMLYPPRRPLPKGRLDPPFPY